MRFGILYKKTYLKDLRKLPKNVRIKVEELSFDTLPETENLSDIKGLEKLVSHEGCYKIRFGDYRVGIQIDFGKDLIVCCQVLHRKEIYRFYP